MRPNPPEAIVLAVLWRRTRAYKPKRRNLVRGNAINATLRKDEELFAPYSRIQAFFRECLSHIDETEIHDAAGAYLLNMNRKSSGI